MVHYNISSSLENYVQEAGRAGRDEAIHAQCCILFNEEDLNTHFSLLRRSKLTQADIQLVWNAIKSMRNKRFAISALELARRAGLECDELQLETKIKNAIAALEIAGYVRRTMNAPPKPARIISRTAWALLFPRSSRSSAPCVRPRCCTTTTT